MKLLEQVRHTLRVKPYSYWTDSTLSCIPK
jgi:hypothetical protein